MRTNLWKMFRTTHKDAGLHCPHVWHRLQATLSPHSMAWEGKLPLNAFKNTVYSTSSEACPAFLLILCSVSDFGELGGKAAPTTCTATRLTFPSVLGPRAKVLVERDTVQIVVQAGEDELLLGVIILTLGIENRKVPVETGFESLA